MVCRVCLFSFAVLPFFPLTPAYFRYLSLRNLARCGFFLVTLFLFSLLSLSPYIHVVRHLFFLPSDAPLRPFSVFAYFFYILFSPPSDIICSRCRHVWLYCMFWPVIPVDVDMHDFVTSSTGVDVLVEGERKKSGRSSFLSRKDTLAFSHKYIGVRN